LLTATRHGTWLTFSQGDFAPPIKAKIARRLVDSIKPDAAGDLFLRDADLSRPGLRIKPSGRDSSFILYRPGGRTQRYFTFGRPGALAPAQARDRARRPLIAADDGADPADEKRGQGRSDGRRSMRRLCRGGHGRARAHYSKAS